MPSRIEIGFESSNIPYKIKEWGDTFHLPKLCRLSENGYKNLFGHLNTGIPYYLFHRNALIALKRAEELAGRNSQ